MKTNSWVPQGTAFLDYQNGHTQNTMVIHSDEGSWEVPVAIYFRGYESLPDHEYYAIELCKGKILDIGAGTGCHALILQHFGFRVAAIDISPACVEVMKKNGVRDATCIDFFRFNRKGFDTLLLLMNGIGFVKTLAGFRHFLEHAETILKPGGQIIFDSTDLRVEMPHLSESRSPGRFYGTVNYQIEYNDTKGKPFRWLFIDPERMRYEAEKMGWAAHVVFQDADGQYLARLYK